MEDKIKTLQDKLGELGDWRFRIANYNDSCRIRILGTSELNPQYTCDILFKEVDFMSCPLHFDNATFRNATKEERDLLDSQYFFGWSHMITCILVQRDIETVPDKFYIFSEDVEYNFSINGSE